ncbi:MAG: protein kinase [Planctomycetes bacterium]|nr:protein kinase [Planctomycetota bacterium]
MPADSDLLYVVVAVRLGFAAPIPAEQAEALEESLAPAARAAVRSAVAAHIAMSGGDVRLALERLRRSAATEPRFRLGAEIGRGGLGRVVEARDLELDRIVAVKLVLDDLPDELKERFLREARLTARLEHPNIVPVHGLVTPAGEAPMLAMKRVRGRDLGAVLRALAKGDASTVAEWSRPRLLAMFQDICLGVAFAHDRGVIHRDLKPANVMLGDFGETLVVDWGLAKEGGARRSPQGEGGSREAGETADSVVVGEIAETFVPTHGSGDSTKTLDGDVVGTPAYMAPEQAAGRVADVDERSDIYALGAILYELLTFRPPVDGDSLAELLSHAQSGVNVPPSQRLRARDPKSTSIPPELDAIAMKALALRKEDRFQSAMDLHREIQLFLEGVKERERNHRLAEEAVVKAKEAMERQGRLREEAQLAAEAAMRVDKGVQPWEADKSAVWKAQDLAKGLERDSVEAFAEANALLTGALSHERDHAEARRLKAELFWAKFREAETRGDEKDMLLQRRVVEQYNDGALDALLKGDGTLTVRTRAYPCRCLLDGRDVAPGEWAWQGYHPFSGRALDGHKGAEGLTELEPQGLVRLKVHAASCEPGSLDGADVWLWKHEDIGRRLVPVTPRDVAGAAARPAPATMLDAAFDSASPGRPQGPGVWLGRTPIEKHPLPMGSYLLVVSREGHLPIRVPIFLPRCGAWEQEVTLFRPEEIPPGFVPVAAGPFGSQGDPENALAGPGETKVVDDVFIARHPVTCREYVEFLNELARSDPAQAARRVPRSGEESGFYWPGPPYAVPTAAWLAGASPELRTASKRLLQSPVDWEEDWPVFSVSWQDAMAYAAWKRRGDSRATTIPHELDWEKAARGTDRRFFPWGNQFDYSRANANRSHPGGARPARVTEFPGDESPYGVRGQGGNSRNVCLNDPGPDYPGWRLVRGGNWTDTGPRCRATVRLGNSSRSVSEVIGIRPACLVRLARPLIPSR